MHESDTLAPTRPIESASASTVPQTNSSNFAYVLTGVALGIVSLLAIAFALLLFGVVGDGGQLVLRVRLRPVVLRG